MPLVVDAYNVLHVVGVLPPDLAGIGLSDLVRMIGSGRYANEQVQLICDGTRHDHVRAGRYGGVVVRFSGAGRQADDLIRHAVDTSTAPRRLTVVSSDHAVQRSARRRRCRLLTSEEFLAQLASDAETAAQAKPKQEPPPEGPLRSGQVEGWMRVFGIDEATIESVEAELPAAPLPEEPDEAEPTTPPPPMRGPVLPPDIVAEAERLLEDPEDER